MAIIRNGSVSAHGAGLFPLFLHELLFLFYAGTLRGLFTAGVWRIRKRLSSVCGVAGTAVRSFMFSL